MKALLTLAASLLASPTAAEAQAQPQAQATGPTVSEMLMRAQALLNGQLSPDSPEIDALRAEVMAAGRAVREQQAADRQAGRPATFCIPQAAEANSGELITHLQAIPVDRQSRPFREAFADYVKAKYPCPAR